jgi:nucleotide-binding universal stress UspA family protein
MKTKKVLFAYDGSTSANDALEDLKRAGLPSELDMLVVSVAEEWAFEIHDSEQEKEEGGDELTIDRSVVLSRHAKEVLGRSRIFAEHAARAIRKSFPTWTIDTRVYPDSPAWGVLHAAEQWGPDLIILGSHGRSALGRFFLGSVSLKVLSEARSSVRIARHHDCVEGSPVRFLVGLDGTPDSDAAVDEIAARTWPVGSSIKVLSAISPIGVFVYPPFAVDVTQWTEVQESVAKQWEHMEKVTNTAAMKLRNAGLLVDTTVHDGKPADLILDTATEIGADTIFLGARGHRFMERFLLGSVSSAVAARASCSVEVVRTVIA